MRGFPDKPRSNFLTLPPELVKASDLSFKFIGKNNQGNKYIHSLCRESNHSKGNHGQLFNE